jgi:hypothetical protein
MTPATARANLRQTGVRRVQSLRYTITSLALGLIAVWGSENFFWVAPPADLTPAQWLMTWVACSLCVGAVLSAVILTGCDGLQGLFLGACLMGFLVEGVVVGQMYLAFPFQVVWTPMAWHGLVTGVCIFGLARAGPHWPLLRQLAGLVGLGLCVAVFGAFWPVEWALLPDPAAVLLYLAGVGLVVPLACLLIDRLQPLPRPPLAVLLVLPALAAMVWTLQTMAAPDPARLAFPLMVAATVWTMRRLGQRDAFLNLGRPAPPWRHLLFTLAPLVCVLAVVPLWQNGLLLYGNIIAAAVTVPLSLGWWLWLVARAVRRPAR